MIFRFRCVLLVAAGSGSYLILSLYPLAFRASLYCGAAWSKISLLDEISLILLLMLRGSCFLMLGGWLELVWMYSGLSLGFRYGL